jgi:hypothetical protein
LQSVNSDCLEGRAEIAVIGSMYWQHSPPRIDRPSDILDWYARLSDRYIGELRKRL